MTTHFRILAWKIPWTEKPDGLYSTRGRKEQDMAEHTHTHTHTYIFFIFIECVTILLLFCFVAAAAVVVWPCSSPSRILCIGR